MVFTRSGIMFFCVDPNRNNKTLIVVSYPKDVLGFSKLEDYHGRFHILGGVISPSSNKGVELLSIPELEKELYVTMLKKLFLPQIRQ